MRLRLGRTSLSSSSELTKCLIENHHEIAVLDVENIELYCRDILKIILSTSY